MEELGTGVMDAGVAAVYIYPVMPRTSLRDADVSRATYWHRRQLANHVLRAKFRQAPTVLRKFNFGPAFLRRDGIQPSQSGWRALEVSLAGLA